MTKPIGQARSYLPDAIPVAVLAETGSKEPIACLPLRALARLLGIAPPIDGEQLALA